MGQLSVCPLLPGTGFVLFLLRTKLISDSLPADREGQTRPWLPLHLLRAPVGCWDGQRQPCQGSFWQPNCQDLELLPRGQKSVDREMEYCYQGSHGTLEVLFRLRCGTTLQDPETRCVWLRDVVSHSYEASASFGPFSRN